MVPYLTPPLSNSSLGPEIDITPLSGIQQFQLNSQEQQGLQHMQQTQKTQRQPNDQRQVIQQQVSQQKSCLPFLNETTQQPTSSLMIDTTTTGSSSLSGDTVLYKYHKQISKSFQDDLIYCPRTLLNKDELNQCYQLDIMMMMEMNQQCQQNTQQNPASFGFVTQNLQSFKFNPYTSQSFNPSTAIPPSP